MTDAMQEMQKIVEAKIAASFVETMTAEQIKKIVEQKLRESNSYNYKGFLETVMSSAINDAVTSEINKRMQEHQGIIKDAVEKAITVKMVEKIASSIEVDLGDHLKFSLKDKYD